MPSCLSRLFLRCDRSAPRRAREALGALEAIEPIRDDALLLASELVSSAVLRAGCDPQGQIELVADLVPSGVRIAVAEVDDPTSRRAPAEAEAPYLPAGLGMRLVTAIARQWGVERNGRPRLWAELAV